MGRIAALVVLWLVAWVSSAQAQSVWTEQAEEAHERASALRLQWVLARHDLTLESMQRRCFGVIATQAGAALELLRERVALDRMPPGTLASVDRRLDDLEEHASRECTVVRRVDGSVEVDVSRDLWLPFMRRDRAILRLGLRAEMVPRVSRGGYALVPAGALHAALGAFVVDWLRVEVTAAVGWPPGWGPSGRVGARAIATAPWSIFRVGVGLAASVILAMDRVEQIEFSWLGVQVGIPCEVAFEMSENVALTLTGGPIFTQAGQVRVSDRAFSFQAGLMMEVAL